MPSKIQSIPYIVLMGAVFGLNIVISRFATGQFEPLVYVAMRLTIASVLYLVLYPVRTNLHFPTSGSLWLRAGIFGIVGIAIPMTCFVSSLRYLSSGVVSLLQTFSPPLTVVLAHFWLSDERMNRYKAVGVVVAFAGAMALFITGETGLSEFARADWRGYAFVGAAVFTASASGIYGSKYLRDESNYEVSTIRMLVAAAVLMPLAGITIGYDLSAVRLSGYVALIFTSIFGSFLAFLLNFYIIKRFGATAVSESTYVSPIVATIFGALLLNELVTPIMFAGMILMFAGLTIINWTPGTKNQGQHGQHEPT